MSLPIPPNEVPVSSSNIQSVLYNEEDRNLDVTFRNGTRYRYHGVDPSLYSAFLQAPSKGSFLHQHIRHCPTEKL